jgi:transcriptional regulator with XRE-family HTH domain
MKKETVAAHLLRRLDASTGQHQKIAKESGVSQATMSRIYMRKCSPSVNIADRIFGWFEAEDMKNRKSASRISNTQRLMAVPRSRRVSTPTALAQ